MELIEAIKNSAHDNNHEKANYYKIACDTLRARLHDSTDEQFKAYLLPILGDKDQEKILDIMAKVEKNKRRNVPNYQGRHEARPTPYRSIRCFYCNKFGHTKQFCFKWKRDQSGSATQPNKNM
jgi:hypothetical protein